MRRRYGPSTLHRLQYRRFSRRKGKAMSWLGSWLSMLVFILLLTLCGEMPQDNSDCQYYEMHWLDER